jgi:hypothetical protein
MNYKILACTLAFALAAVLPEANAQWWNPMDSTPPKFRGTPFEPKVAYTRNVYEQAQMAINAALEDGDFAKLERMHDEFLATQLRATDGSWMVEAFAVTFDGWFRSRGETRIQKLFADWKEKLPASRLRPVAEAEMWQALAWKARGGGYSGKTPRENIELFNERLRLASRALEVSQDVGTASPMWYWVALIVAGSSGRPVAQFDALFEEALRKFPAYQPLYLTRMNYLLPQWGGDYDQVDRFVAESVKRTAAIDGSSFYAWLYVDVARKHGDNFFEKTAVSWPRMRESFEDMTKRYPDVWNRIVYATFACLARDRETTARLLLLLPDEAQLGAYTRGISTDSCRRFAFDRT